MFPALCCALAERAIPGSLSNDCVPWGGRGGECEMVALCSDVSKLSEGELLFTGCSFRWDMEGRDDTDEDTGVGAEVCLV